MAPGEREPGFVLIHSPLLGPASWAPVADELERRGRKSLIPSLTGVAEAPAPQWRHVPEAVQAATAESVTSVVLAGHSGAGPLLPTIADALAVEVAALIFVDTFLPPASGSGPLAPPGFMDQLRALADDDVLPPWSKWFGEEAMRELVPDERLSARLEAEMPRLPLSYFEASVPVPDGWDGRPCGYLLFTPDTYGQSAADARARDWPVAEVADVPHLAIVTEAVAVTDSLLYLERALGSKPAPARARPRAASSASPRRLA